MRARPIIRTLRGLHTAALRGSTEIVKLLLAHGADPNAKGQSGITPLLLAANEGYRDVAILLGQVSVM